MDRRSSTACRAKQGQPSPKTWASAGALCPAFNGDQVWLEELIGPSSHQFYPSQPSIPSAPSNSPGGSRRSSEGTASLCSWSSGVTGLLHSSIKKQSQEAFQTRLREDRRWGRLAGCPSGGPRGRVYPQTEPGGGSDKLHVWQERLRQGRGSARTHASAKSAKLRWPLEETIEAKLKFSQFLDEVVSNVLDPSCLQAFGKPPPFWETACFTATTPGQPEDEIQEARRWTLRLPCSMAQQQGSLLEQKNTQGEPTPLDPAQKTYLETDIDTVRRDDEPRDQEIKGASPPQPEIEEETVIPPPPQFSQGFEMKSPVPESHCDFPRYPYRSASLPRGINMVSDESHPSL